MEDLQSAELCKIENTAERRWVLSSRFLKAVEESDFPSAIAVLDQNNFDIDCELIYKKTAIHICVANGLFEMAKFLIERGCSLSLQTEKGETPLHLAVKNGYYDFVELLIENRADLSRMDLNGRTVLHYPCTMQSEKMAFLLISAATPYAINIRDCQAMTPLMYACRYGTKDVITAVIEKGGNVSSSASMGATPIFHSLHNKACSPEMVDILLKAGADINHLDDSNATPLLHACRLQTCHTWPNVKGPRVVIHWLIERGCNVHLQDHLGESPLHLAVLLKDGALVRKLLNHGASPTARNGPGFSPLVYALRKESTAMVDLLMDAGAVLQPKAEDVLSEAFIRCPAYVQTLAYAIQRSQTVQPLAKLCRLAVRDALGKNKQVGVTMLPLPQRLARFLLLE